MMPGITPACAGTTVGIVSRLLEIRDHPRLRGNNQLFILWYPAHTGSPPLAREQLKQMQTQTGMIGITPACAGTTAKKA